VTLGVPEVCAGELSSATENFRPGLTVDPAGMHATRVHVSSWFASSLP